MKIKIALSAAGDNPVEEKYLLKADKQIKSLMMLMLNREADSRLLSAQIPENYPWSFALPEQSAKHERCFLGALTMVQGEKKTVFVSYTLLKMKYVEQLLLSDKHFAFWQARILAMLLNNEHKHVDYYQWRNWLLSLERSFFPGWRGIFFKTKHNFSNRKRFLLSTCCKTDLDLAADAGVAIMPWKGWPFCLRHGHAAWLWRQNRQARIIDSQKIIFL